MMQKETQPKENTPRKEKIMVSLSSTVFLTNNEGELLMVQDLDEWGGKWAPIAGIVNVHTNESFDHAAIREAKEELDLDIKLTDIIGVWSYYAYDLDHVEASNPFKGDIDQPKMHIGVSYCAEILGGTYTQQVEEVQNWGFFSNSEIDRMYEQGLIKVPQYNYKAIQLWREKHHHPLTILQSNGI